jgi:hypothetical protein
MVKIFAGPECKLRALPEQVLCDRVHLFKSVFQSGFQQSKEKILGLTEDDPTAFAYILDKIFRNRRPANKQIRRSSRGSTALMMRGLGG